MLDPLLNCKFLKVGILQKYDQWLIQEKTTYRIMTWPVLKSDMYDRRFRDIKVILLLTSSVVREALYYLTRQVS